MAYMLSVTKTAKPFAQQLPSLISSISFINRDNRQHLLHSDDKCSSFLQRRSYGVYTNNNNHASLGLGFGGGTVNFRDPRSSVYRCCHVPMSASAFLLARNMSSIREVGYGSEKIMDTVTNVLEKITDQTGDFVSNQALSISEVVADSSLPVAALQYAIDGIHTFTGLNWWASIAITTVAVNTLLLPLTIKTFKNLAEYRIRKQRLEKIKKESQDEHFQEMIDIEIEERLPQMLAFGFWTGVCVRLPLFFTYYYAIENMVEKIPSFTTGGPTWFVDLTTPDPFFILPLMFTCTYVMSGKVNSTKGLKIRTHIELYVTALYGVIVYSIIFSFPKAFICYGIANNLCQFVYKLILKQPSVKELLNIPCTEQQPQNEPCKLLLK